jgi:hypothetical protein
MCSMIECVFCMDSENVFYVCVCVCVCVCECVYVCIYILRGSGPRCECVKERVKKIKEITYIYI